MGNTTIRRNVDRFIASTGKSESDYYTWASEVGRRMHINKLDALVCAKLNLYTVAHLVYRSTELPDGILASDADHYILCNSENPYELAKFWIAAKANADNYISKESILAEHLRAFPKSDFERHGDPNHLVDVSKAWFRKDSINLDVQLMEINDMHLYSEWITLQDAIDFVMNYRPGSYKSPCQLYLERVEAAFKGVTIFRLKEYYVQHIIKMCEMELVDNGDVPF